MSGYSITRRFLFTVQHAEKHLCALIASHLHVNWGISAFPLVKVHQSSADFLLAAPSSHLTDVVDAIGGWSTKGVGQGYGKGFGLELKARWMQTIT